MSDGPQQHAPATDRPSPLRVLVTGSAGFIGFHLARLLLDEGAIVHGYDGMTDYYDVTLKRDRQRILGAYAGYTDTEAMIEDGARFKAVVADFEPDAIVHLAAQAGVRHSMKDPRAYIDANVVGTFNVLEAARTLPVRHLMLASSSSVYGASTDLPYSEDQRADAPLSLYAATKKAGEAIAHSYSHLHRLPVTCFRFFTVYGPWGRPDMATSSFTTAILEGQTINLYNHGDMWRDFTYIADLVRAIRLLMDQTPGAAQSTVAKDSISPAAPFRVVNIGNSKQVTLSELIDAIEAATGRTAIRNPMPMQPGDVRSTLADASLLKALTGYQPQTPIAEGIQALVDWHRDYYNC